MTYYCCTLVSLSCFVDKETLLGHGTGLDDKYYRPTDTELLEEYQKAVDNLTINEENRLKTKAYELGKDQARD
ncbi:MAG: hypothetical protein M3Y53_12220 [Thermoproteota archaeon]|nr:hypothetical protein [Thermoproteota archaeon]